MGKDNERPNLPLIEDNKFLNAMREQLFLRNSFKHTLGEGHGVVNHHRKL
jgi:hypothetical protein